MTQWLAGYDIVQLGPTGGTFDQRVNPKLCWHTTEGYSLSGAESAFWRYPPHLGVDPNTGECHQYIPVDRSAYSLGNSDAEDSYVVQVEVVGFAAESHDWPPQRLQWLADHVVQPVQQAVGVPPVAAPQGFHGQGEGIVLATPDSPIRMSLGEWDGFAGHVGHQHVPGDDHWDPGRLDIDTILGGSSSQPRRKDDDVPYYLFSPHGGGRWVLTNMRTDTRYVDDLQDARNVDWFLKSMAGVDGLVCNRDQAGEVAGPIAVDDAWLAMLNDKTAAS